MGGARGRKAPAALFFKARRRLSAIFIALGLSMLVTAGAHAVGLLNVSLTTAVSPAQTGAVYQFRGGAPRNLTIQGSLAYGSGGTSADAYVQTSLDGGQTWCDIAEFHFTTASARKLVNLSSLTAVTTQATPTDGSMTANATLDGVIGTQLRVKYQSSGTYAGASVLAIDISTARLDAGP